MTISLVIVVAGFVALCWLVKGIIQRVIGGEDPLNWDN